MLNEDQEKYVIIDGRSMVHYDNLSNSVRRKVTKFADAIERMNAILENFTMLSALWKKHLKILQQVLVQKCYLNKLVVLANRSRRQ